MDSNSIAKTYPRQGEIYLNLLLSISPKKPGFLPNLSAKRKD